MASPLHDFMPMNATKQTQPASVRRKKKAFKRETRKDRARFAGITIALVALAVVVTGVVLAYPYLTS